MGNPHTSSVLGRHHSDFSFIEGTEQQGSDLSCVRTLLNTLNGLVRSAQIRGLSKKSELGSDNFKFWYMTCQIFQNPQAKLEEKKVNF